MSKATNYILFFKKTDNKIKLQNYLSNYKKKINWDLIYLQYEKKNSSFGLFIIGYYNYYIKKNYKIGLDYFYKALELNNVFAMFYIGLYLLNSGKYKESQELFEKCIKNGNARGYCGLGKVYYYGFDKKYLNKILELFKKGAELGDSQCLTHLGIIYSIEGTEFYNYHKTVYYLKKGVELNDSQAMHCLGIIYYYGYYNDDIKLDDGMKLLNQAIDNNYTPSITFVGNIYSRNNKLINYKKAIQLYNKAIELNNDDAMVEMGCLYKHGEGIEQDYKKAYDLFLRASKLNNAKAFICLGILYKNGQGVPFDMIQSIKYYKKGHLINKNNNFKDSENILLTIKLDTNN